MKILKELFESINKEAFKLKSIKEIYTRTLSPEELDDNNIDYISGFQVIDQNLRITILEGITGQGKAMSLVKEKLPKLELNSAQKKIFSNSKILFNKRIYSNFNLCLKFIKLRNPLSQILGTADIYLKANKYREIFNAFMQLGFILQSPTFEAITNANLFPSFESLSQLERKYADIINDEDLSGLKTEKKKKKKILNNNVHTSSSDVTTDTNIILNKNNVNSSLQNNKRNISSAYSNANNISNLNNNLIVGNNNASNISSNNSNDKSTKEQQSQQSKLCKLDSYNYEFIKKKKEEIGKSMSFNRRENFLKTHKFNCEILAKLNQKNIGNSQHFWHYEKMTPLENIIKSDKSNSNNPEELGYYNSDGINIYPNSSPSSNDELLEQSANKSNKSSYNSNLNKEPLYMYSQQKNNLYSKHLNEIRQKIANDKDNYYTYSMDYLSLSFPYIENKNFEYERYVENKNVKFNFYFLYLLT